MEALRLKKYQTYLKDGRGYCEYVSEDKSQVLVALLIGTEPLKIESQDDLLNIDEVVLRMATHIRKVRKADKAAEKGSEANDAKPS